MTLRRLFLISLASGTAATGVHAQVARLDASADLGLRRAVELEVVAARAIVPPEGLQMSSEFVLSSEPDLHSPSLVIGLPDVGYVALRVIDYLKSKLAAQEFGHIEPQGFSTVPWVSVKKGVIEDLELLRNGFSFWKNTSGGNDLVLFRSEQPTARPYEYVEAILVMAQHVGVRRVDVVVSFGAVGITHLEPAAALGVVNMPHLTEVLVESGVQPYPQYKGIGTIHSSFLWPAKGRNLEALGLWAPMPHYIARLPFPWSNCPV